MSYPNINDDNFNNKLSKKFKKYNIPKKRKTMRQICFPEKWEFQIPQQFLAKYINPNTPYKGVLIFHRIGAGKTCAAVNIAEHWKKYRKVVFVVPAALKGSFSSEIRSKCGGDEYLTNKERNALEEFHPSSKKYKQIIKDSDKRIDKDYKIYSHNKFIELAEVGKINLKNSVLIIDEIQNMVSEEGKFYHILYNTINSAPKNLRIVLMSATPMFDKPIEIALTMNLLRIPFELPVGREFEKLFIDIHKKRNGELIYEARNLDIFKERIKGYVSYFRGAPPYTFPEEVIKYVKCEMSDFQYKIYKCVLKNENSYNKLKKVKDVADLPNNFFIGTRMVSNVVFPNKKVNEKGFESFTGKYLSFEKLQKYSPKFYKIMRRISRSSGTIFVYSNFKEFGGIKSFIKVLETHGYLDYIKNGEGRKRFAVWSSDESNKIKDEIKAVFNQQSNANGSKIKIMLGSPSIKEGVSLLRVQQVHILEPYWNQSRLEQIIGRANRYCSHTDLPKEKRLVKVYIYIAYHKKEKVTIDQYICKLSKKKNKIIKQFELAMKEVAIDCNLFKNANVYRGEDDIKCDA